MLFLSVVKNTTQTNLMEIIEHFLHIEKFKNENNYVQSLFVYKSSTLLSPRVWYTLPQFCL